MATNDCHYLHREDSPAHEVLLCIQTGKTLQEADRMKFSSEEFYFKSPQEMRELFQDHSDALAHTLEIADRCNLDLRFDEKHIPAFRSLRESPSIVPWTSSHERDWDNGCSP